MQKSALSFFLLLLSSCGVSTLSVHQQIIDARYLASTHVKTPDPRQNHPPRGQMLVVEWQIPYPVVLKDAQVVLYVVFKNYEEKKICYALDRRIGYETYSLLNEEFDEKKGILTYRAEIVTADQEVYQEWKHQLWVNVIHVDENSLPLEGFEEDYRKENAEEERRESAKPTNSSVETQSMQGSVIDTAYSKEEGSSERS